MSTMSRRELLGALGGLSGVLGGIPVSSDTKAVILTVDPDLMKSGDYDVDVEGLRIKVRDRLRKVGLPDVEIILVTHLQVYGINAEPRQGDYPAAPDSIINRSL